MKTREAAKTGCQDFCFVSKNTWIFLSGNWAAEPILTGNVLHVSQLDHA